MFDIWIWMFLDITDLISSQVVTKEWYQRISSNLLWSILWKRTGWSQETIYAFKKDCSCESLRDLWRQKWKLDWLDQILPMSIRVSSPETNQNISDEEFSYKMGLRATSFCHPAFAWNRRYFMASERMTLLREKRGYQVVVKSQGFRFVWCPKGLFKETSDGVLWHKWTDERLKLKCNDAGCLVTEKWFIFLCKEAKSVYLTTLRHTHKNGEIRKIKMPIEHEKWLLLFVLQRENREELWTHSAYSFQILNLQTQEILTTVDLYFGNFISGLTTNRVGDKEYVYIVDRKLTLHVFRLCRTPKGFLIRVEKLTTLALFCGESQIKGIIGIETHENHLYMMLPYCQATEHACFNVAKISLADLTKPRFEFAALEYPESLKSCSSKRYRFLEFCKRQSRGPWIASKVPEPVVSESTCTVQ